jgi:hypothetical protein
MVSKQKFYIPTSNTPQLVIQSLNDFLGIELSLPGNWSPKIFYNDLRNYPVKDKKELAKQILESCQKDTSYLAFFEQSRGQPRSTNEFQLQLWGIFSRGSIMLYLESLFLHLLGIDQLTDEINVLVLYLNALSQVPIDQWDQILKGIGACCYQYFIKEPFMYAKLPHRQNIESPEDMTDQELLDAIESSLLPTAYRGKISLEDSRSYLIQQYRSKINQ